MSTIPNPSCGGELAVVGLGSAVSSHSAPFFSVSGSVVPAEHEISIPAIDALGTNRKAEEPDTVAAKQQRKLNRIAEVRKCQGFSERTVCKRLNVDLPTLRQLEDPTRDLLISELTKVQAALEVPLVELLEDTNSLARPIQERAKLVRIMKTVGALEECSLNTRSKRLVSMLREQLVDLMPELAEVGSWPQFGSRRGAASIARILEQEINVTQISTNDP